MRAHCPDQPLAEPQNTLSNLAYLIAGIGIIVRSLREGFDRRRVPALMVGMSLCFVAAASAYYHATLNDIRAAGMLPSCNPNAPKGPQYLDIVGVYLALFAMICYGLDRLLRSIEVDKKSGLSIVVAAAAAMGLFWVLPAVQIEKDNPAKLPWVTGLVIWLACVGLAGVILVMIRRDPRGWLVWLVWGLMMLACALLGAVMRIWLPFDSTLVFTVLVGILLGVTGLNLLLANIPEGQGWRLSFGEVGLALSVLTVGLVVRVSDGGDFVNHVFMPNTLCSSASLLQAHASWHVLSALALLLTFDLIEKSRNSDQGSALLPAPGSVVTWLARPGNVLGRARSALIFNLGFSLAALMFGVVMLLNFKLISLSALVPVITAIYLWLITYLRLGIGTDSHL